MTTNVSAISFGLQLGRFLLSSPLRVDLHECLDGSWLATLEPAELTQSEWGYGETAQEALRDLETTIAEMMEFFAKTPEERLGEPLLEYKRTLARYVSVNTTTGMYTYSEGANA